jgi:hypothetical protein
MAVCRYTMSLLARPNELLQHFRQASSMQWISAKF